MIIDFTEIADDHAFENFCMHLMQDLGLKIPVPPAIGADGGRDIISEEPSRFSARGFRWLVSCKHYAGSKRSVGVSNDEAKANKLVEHGCNGFMFFFSTAYTEGFQTSVEKVCYEIRKDFKIFNVYEIERILLSSPVHYPLIRQYFPISHDRLVKLKGKTPCCSNVYPEDALYAVYTKNSEDGDVSYEVFGECCIGYCVDELNEQGISYGVSQLRSARDW